MELKVVIDKKFAFIILGAVLVLAGAIYGYAQSGVSNPGHDWYEIDNRPAGLDDGDDFEANTDTKCDSVNSCTSVCIGNDCRSSWPETSFSQAGCYNINYFIGQTFCNEGDYVAGVHDDGGGMPGMNGVICCPIN